MDALEFNSLQYWCSHTHPWLEQSRYITHSVVKQTKKLYWILRRIFWKSVIQGKVYLLFKVSRV